MDEENVRAFIGEKGRRFKASASTAGRGLFCGVQNHSRMYCKTIKIYA